LDLRRFDHAFANTNRLRTTATDHLLAAARECGVKRMVVQSFCGWPYARSGGHVKSEDDPLDPTPPHEQHRTLAAIRYLEDIVGKAGTPTGVVLRYGGFYGPDTGLLDAATIEQLRKRRMPVIGGGTAWWSSSTSTMPRRLPPLRSSEAAASTTSSMTTPRRCTSGFPRLPPCSGPSRRAMYRRGSRGSWRGSLSSS
jgi:hypothetical protein